MISTITYHDANIRFSDIGNGDPVILLHGYLESLEIWGSFADGLAKHYRVIAADLPGHGESGIFSTIDTMAVMADAVKHVLDHLDIGRAVLVGHSMGGYAVLAFEEIFPEITLGYVLFHSHALADTDEKRFNRDREISLVKEGKKTQFINVNIPNAFASENLQILAAEVENAKDIARDTPDHGIICALEGMKTRPDRQHVLRESMVPVLIVAGQKDNYIPFDVYQQHFSLAPKTNTLVLEHSGHMGFIEEKEKSLDGILRFLDKVYGS
jgi:pimeloyl-ACP methyl ester carboxylesterase